MRRATTTIIHTRFGWLPLALVLGACSRDTVDLGGGRIQQQDTVVGTTCKESPVVERSVRVWDQDDLDSLAGCEEIRGDLIVERFANADLSPLASLRAVGGSLELGAEPTYPPDVPRDLASRRAFTDSTAALEKTGWLESLTGLEALERVGNLYITDSSVTSLEPLSNLRNVSSHYDGAMAGILRLMDNDFIRDLHGLQNAGGMRELNLVGNASLESLDGLIVGTRLSNLVIQFSPFLSDISALVPLESVDSDFQLRDLGIVDADALAHLRGGGRIALINNAELTQVDALGGLERTDFLAFAFNPKLRNLPAFPKLVVLDAFRAIGNTELTAIDLDLPALVNDVDVGGTPIFASAMIDIQDNPKLMTVSLPAGNLLVQKLAIHENPSLTNIDLGSLERVDSLTIEANANLAEVSLGALKAADMLAIEDNASLTSVAFGPLETLDVLRVVNNPRLALHGLAGVQIAEIEVHGNADDTASGP